MLPGSQDSSILKQQLLSHLGICRRPLDCECLCVTKGPLQGHHLTSLQLDWGESWDLVSWGELLASFQLAAWFTFCRSLLFSCAESCSGAVLSLTWFSRDFCSAILSRTLTVDLQNSFLHSLSYPHSSLLNPVTQRWLLRCCLISRFGLQSLLAKHSGRQQKVVSMWERW